MYHRRNRGLGKAVEATNVGVAFSYHSQKVSTSEYSVVVGGLMLAATRIKAHEPRR
jgi:hypothetical protein